MHGGHGEGVHAPAGREPALLLVQPRPHRGRGHRPQAGQEDLIPHVVDTPCCTQPVAVAGRAGRLIPHAVDAQCCTHPVAVYLYHVIRALCCISSEIHTPIPQLNQNINH